MAREDSDRQPIQPNQPAQERTSRLIPPGPILLYDGECGVCAASVQWMLRHERSSDLRFAAQQSGVGRHLRETAGVPDDVDSLIWIDQQGTGTKPRARVHSAAVLAALEHVGGPWLLVRAALLLVPRPLRDFGYRCFAQHRRSLVKESCPIPTPEQRRRFLPSP